MRDIRFRAWDWRVFLPKTALISFDWNWQLNKDLIITQYTWLNDKLWNPIYEWDVVIDRFSNKKTIIKWTPDTYDWDSIYCSGYFTESYSKDDIEIIWNIYENPELINN